MIPTIFLIVGIRIVPIEEWARNPLFWANIFRRSTGFDFSLFADGHNLGSKPFAPARKAGGNVTEMRDYIRRAVHQIFRPAGAK